MSRLCAIALLIVGASVTVCGYMRSFDDQSSVNIERNSQHSSLRDRILSKIARGSHVAMSRKKRWDFTTYQITENRRGPIKISRLHSSFDNNTGAVKYSITGEGAGSIFFIDPDTGDLTAQHALDRESKASYNLNVSARNREGVEVESASQITVVVQDVNDNHPSFSPGQHYAVVKERSKIGQIVTTITARDDDDPDGPYGQIKYTLLPSTGSNKFMIHQQTGEVKTTTSNLDRESMDTYELIIKAKDDPDSDLGYSATTTLTVSVTDVNDSPPRFINKPYRPAITEDSDIGYEVLRVKTIDPDLRNNARSSYSILPGNDSSKFRIETIGNAGVIKVNEPLDYETALNNEYRFRVKATNTRPDPQLSYLGAMEDVADVVVSLLDINEPPVFDKAKYVFSVSEGAIPGFPIHGVTASDPEGDPFTYSLEDDSGKFSIGPSSGMISVADELDREETDHYVITVRAGVAGAISKAEVRIDVEDVNDNPPRPLDGDKLELILCENHKGKTQALRPNIEMTDSDDPNLNGPPFHYYRTKDRIYDRHFKLVDNGDSTATLHTTHNDFYASTAKEYPVPIVVQDSGKPSLNATYIITVRVCQCSEDGKSLCNAVAQTGAIRLEVLVVLLAVFVLLLVLVVALITVRRRRARHHEALIKGSISTCEDEVRENIINYTEEGGGEEDTAAFDLSALQRDYCSSSSGSQVKSRLDFSSPPSTKVSMIPPYPTSSRTRHVPSGDIKDFIVDRKGAEDTDDQKLAFDSLQVYAYEGEGSDAGSLSSLCSSSDDNEQDYDYLREWGPRFNRLADMYGSGRYYSSDDDDARSDVMSILSSQLGRSTLGRPRRVSPC